MSREQSLFYCKKVGRLLYADWDKGSINSVIKMGIQCSVSLWTNSLWCARRHTLSDQQHRNTCMMQTAAIQYNSHEIVNCDLFFFALIAILVVCVLIHDCIFVVVLYWTALYWTVFLTSLTLNSHNVLYGPTKEQYMGNTIWYSMLQYNIMC